MSKNLQSLSKHKNLQSLSKQKNLRQLNEYESSHPLRKGPKLFYRSKSFSLNIQPSTKKTFLVMKLFIPVVNTRELPHTDQFLKENFPSVLTTECFNDNNLPFNIEVKTTELGHLFEHILLDQLCLIKLSSGTCQQAMFTGRTDWDWGRDQRGIFHISISVSESENYLLAQAIEKTVTLTESLISASSQKEIFSPPPSFFVPNVQFETL